MDRGKSSTAKKNTLSVPHNYDTGSSRISSDRRDAVRERDGSVCILCGLPRVTVAHIVAKTQRLDWQAFWLRQVGISPDFDKREAENLLTLCSPHHDAYDQQDIMLAPCTEDVDALILYEQNDFRRRQQVWANTGRMLPRAFPPLSSLRGSAEYAFVHSHGRQRLPLGPWLEDVTHPAAEFPQTVYYSHMPVTDAGDVRHLPVAFEFPGRFTIDLRSGSSEYRVNPWALICKALLGLHSTYKPARVIVNGQEYPETITPLANKLVQLRDLYNRLLAAPPKSSAGTVRPNFHSMPGPSSGPPSHYPPPPGPSSGSGGYPHQSHPQAPSSSGSYSGHGQGFGSSAGGYYRTQALTGGEGKIDPQKKQTGHPQEGRRSELQDANRRSNREGVEYSQGDCAQQTDVAALGDRFRGLQVRA